ncbi:hypothetical protein GCM10007380_43130 [Gottfriedia solisilvae]|uniref:Uncharacterized protein n=2 Tax=Gottfriedia solisilvae TaxID=1516104 RepID=A0A8J3AX63_9BACI|nr:hypothetical protein GCM10007380_43130 [Gottfriedia solisilvae]
MICNTSPESKGKDGVKYLTKQNGVLEKLGYIRKVKEYPLEFFYLDEHDDVVVDFYYQKPESVEFILKTENDTHLPNLTVNYPVKAFHSCSESEQDNYYNGYFYFSHYTTEIPLDVFIYCMSRKEIGKIGFYLYCILKSKCDYFYAKTNRRGYIRALDALAGDTGIGKTTLSQMLKILEKHNMIFNSHNHYVIGLPKGKKVPPNTYITFDYKDFYKYEKKSVNTRKVVSYEFYDSNVGVYINSNEEISEENIDLKMPISL